MAVQRLAPVTGSGQDVLNHAAVDIGEAKVAPGIPIGEAFVVESEQMQNCGVEIVHMNGVFHRRHPQLV
jgi:hypothetical protein